MSIMDLTSVCDEVSDGDLSVMDLGSVTGVGDLDTSVGENVVKVPQNNVQRTRSAHWETGVWIVSRPFSYADVGVPEGGRKMFKTDFRETSKG